MKLFDLSNSISNEYEVIKRCLDFLLRKGGPAIENGRHVVEEDGIFLNITEYESRLPENGKWEAHAKYADLQLVLEGEEYMYVSDIKKMEIGEFDADRDYIPCHGSAEASYVLNHSNGILLMPEDAHMPCMCTGNKPSNVKKAVFKIPVTYFENVEKLEEK